MKRLAKYLCVSDIGYSQNYHSRQMVDCHNFFYEHIREAESCLVHMSIESKENIGLIKQACAAFR